MTLEQLRIFVAVAEREHVTRAAEALGLTQSAVSSAIAVLETQYRVPLFHRIGRRIELSAEGHHFLDEARQVLARASTAERFLSDLSGLKWGSVAVQASQTIASYWLPSRLMSFHQAFPHITVNLTIGNTSRVAKAVSDGTAELGFVEGLVDDPSLELTEVDRDRLVIVVAPGHPWSRKQRLSVTDILDSAWILRESGSGTRSEFERAIAVYGISLDRLRVPLEFPSNEAVRTAVEAGAGATAISEMIAAPALQSGTLVCVPFRLPERVFHIVQHRNRYKSRAGCALRDLMMTWKQIDSLPAANQLVM
jgi:DNA-binding transcriptional LysR family regulator